MKNRRRRFKKKKSKIKRFSYDGGEFEIRFFLPVDGGVFKFTNIIISYEIAERSLLWINMVYAYSYSFQNEFWTVYGCFYSESTYFWNFSIITINKRDFEHGQGTKFSFFLFFRLIFLRRTHRISFVLVMFYFLRRFGLNNNSEWNIRLYLMEYNFTF